MGTKYEPEGLENRDCRDLTGEQEPGQVPAEALSPDLLLLLAWGGKLYWSSVGMDGWLNGASPRCWSPGDWELQLGLLVLSPLSWELRSYWEYPRLSSVSHGPENDEGGGERGSDDERRQWFEAREEEEEEDEGEQAVEAEEEEEILEGQ